MLLLQDIILEFHLSNIEMETIILELKEILRLLLEQMRYQNHKNPEPISVMDHLIEVQVVGVLLLQEVGLVDLQVEILLHNHLQLIQKAVFLLQVLIYSFLINLRQHLLLCN